MAGHTLFILAISLVVNLCSGAILAPKTESRHGEMEDLEWWQKAVFYQIYPRSFMDSNGDGVGDLQGIISKMDHLKDAGIGATWLSPILKSPMKDFGYDIESFYEIDPVFGTMADFEMLLEKAKTLDIKIIMDFVPNHSSDQCEWFKDSVAKKNGKGDWYIWEDPIWNENKTEHFPPNNWVSVFRGSAWEFNKVRGQYYLHQFAVQQPDLNYRNPAVVQEMKNVLKFWLDKGIGGFRIDAINHQFEVDKKDFNGTFPNEPLTGYPDQGPDDYGYLDHIYTKDLHDTHRMVYEWRALLDTYTSGNFSRIIMTEAYTDIDSTMLYYGNGTIAGAHFPFNFGLITSANENSTAPQLKKVIDEWMKHMPIGKTSNWVIGNHDQWRVATRYGTDRIDGLNMLVLLLPGVAVTYNGEEIGMVNTFISWEDTLDPQACNTLDSENYWKASRDPARTPFQWDETTSAGFSTNKTTWLPVNTNYREINLKKQLQADRSHYKIYRDLAKMRSFHTFTHGGIETKALDDDIFVFVRSLEDHDSYVVVINLAANNHTINLSIFKDLNEELIVMETSIQSTKPLSSKVTTKAVELRPFESLVLKSAASSVTAGLMLIITALFLNMFQ